jgi:hypothetical protein
MTERDVFETRFHAAVHGYIGRVSSDLDPVEPAHRIAVAKPRRSGLAAALRMPVITVPRLAWVLLLLAGLLAVTIGAMLVAGSRTQSNLPAVVPPILPAFECPAGSNPDAPGPIDQARPPLTFSADAMAFDRRAGRIVTLVDPDGTGKQVQTWAFDVCTNTWTRMGDAPRGVPADPLAYDADSGLLVTVDTAFASTTLDTESGRTWAYDLGADAWTSKSRRLMAAHGGPRHRLIYDPGSGSVIVAYGAWGGTDLWAYDVGPDTWTAISTGGFTSNALVAYDASVDRLISYDFGPEGPTTRLFDLRRGTWTDSAAVTPSMPVNWFTTGNEITYDEAARRTIIFSVGKMLAYDAAADRWTVVFEEAPVVGGFRCASPRCRSYATTIYDPVNKRLIVYGGQYRDPSRVQASQAPGARTEEDISENDWVQDDSVIAFDLATGTWSILLEASEVRQAQ